jgi:hypothetical protein
MIKDNIVQFVCYITNLEEEKFIPEWEEYAKKEMFKKQEPVLLQQEAGSKSRFRFLSQHQWPSGDTHFSFKDEKKSSYFHDQQVQIVHIGGYLPLQYKKNKGHQNTDTRLVVFAGHNEYDLDFYRQLPLQNHLNIYQAYYESCTYGHILEFFTAEKNITELALSLKQRPGIETTLYKECLIPHL